MEGASKHRSGVVEKNVVSLFLRHFYEFSILFQASLRAHSSADNVVFMSHSVNVGALGLR